MQQTIFYYCVIITLAPLIAASFAGLLGRKISNVQAHSVTILGVAIAFVFSCLALYTVKFTNTVSPINLTAYIWGTTGNLSLQIGFLIDELSTLMMVIVTFVSLMVHIYTVGYMQGDPGYKRFFSYISLFTFSMLMLVMSNNFLQLFFGWEAVGLMSYLLIGFWYKKPSAIQANLKAFIVNRVGDFGFLLGIAGVFLLFNSLDYTTVFNQVETIVGANQFFIFSDEVMFPAIHVICILLFVGAMGKSAQVPLHVWLPDSMEGPTPISALIHAATMVTAGVFMVARLSPIFEHSDVALNFILIIGSITAFFMGLIGLVNQDIKRIIAYSTLSQLGYMMVAVAVSSYAVGIFHLMTHAFFKALLFLGAGSVIIGVHHEQNIWKMGGLRRKMPITFLCMLIGTLAIVGMPFFSGFFSKDLIIESVAFSNLRAAKIAYWAVLAGVFVTSLYSFRLLFVVFFGKTRMDSDSFHHVHESPSVVWLPLVTLAIPSIVSGYLFIKPLLHGYFGNALQALPEHTPLPLFLEEFHGALSMALHGFATLPFFFMLAGLGCAVVLYVIIPSLPMHLKKVLKPFYLILEHKFGFDLFYNW
ncbi:MAG TPA: NADH-quinone oxidoreductase subunit L, partial [Gammaproteobacteria bacterium]|nr:NADH-quinone oxidoreductase subunit L [Gammaproteobacteria bacterium]